MLFSSYKIMISGKKNQYQINIILPLQKPHPFRISIWYGANMYIPDKIPNSWKCENPMLIWYLFNKCGWLEPYQSEDPSPTLPTYRGKEEKGKLVEDKKGEGN